MADIVQTLPDTARAELHEAFRRLEYPSFAARLSGVIGMPLGAGLKQLPPSWERAIRRAAEIAIARTLQISVATLPAAQSSATTRHELYTGACMGAGAIGGFLGLPGLLLELPVITGLILRSIAEIARAEGEQLADPQTRWACIEVFGSYRAALREHRQELEDSGRRQRCTGGYVSRDGQGKIGTLPARASMRATAERRPG